MQVLLFGELLPVSKEKQMIDQLDGLELPQKMRVYSLGERGGSRFLQEALEFIADEISLLGRKRDQLTRERDEAVAELKRVKALLDVPAQEDFLYAAVTEAKFQRTRWEASDVQKTDSDWFWLVGYLVGKAFHDVRGKRLHHLTAAAAALANWHAQAIARGETMPTERGNQKDHVGRIVQ